MLIKKLSAFLLLLIMSCSAMATEAVAVEDITPATAEGPIPVDQIPPITNVTKLLGITAPAPISPATVPTKPPTATPPVPGPATPMTPSTPTINMPPPPQQPINMPPPQQPPLNQPPAAVTTPSPHAMYSQPISPGEVMRWE